MPATLKVVKAKDLRRGDRIVHNSRPLYVRDTDNVDGFIEVVCTDMEYRNGYTFMVRWDKTYTLWTNDE